MKTDSPQKIQLSDYKPYPYYIPSVQLVFELEKERTIVSTKMRLDLMPSFGEDEKIILNGEGLEIISISRNGEVLSENQYSYNDDLLILEGAKRVELLIKVAINPLKNTALSGLYVSSGRFCTQCEAEGFRRITFWPDRPDVMSHFFVRLQANKEEYPTLLSNGNLVSYGDFGDGRHFAEWDDPWAKPSYLFALVAGSFDKISDNFTTMNGNEVELNIYVEQGDSGRAKYAMDSLKRSMKWDEENYLREYDLDIFNIVAVRDFNAGAMENKGLNIFNSSLLLADEETATDLDYARIEGVVAHEYFHNWSGNRVTCRDWFQLSLKEGFTVYRDQEFSADMRSRAVNRIQSIVALRARQFAEDNGPNAHSVRPHEYAAIDNFYTSTIYEKGAEVIRVARNILGEEAFIAGAINYFEKNDGRAATIEDWLNALRENSQNNLDGIERWYSQAGTPIVTLKTNFENNVLELIISQETKDTPNQTNKDWVPIPMDIAFFDYDGNRLILDMAQGKKANLISINHTGKELILRFENMPKKPIISMMRGFSAPIVLNSDHTDEELAVLAQYDDDFYVKWESLQTIARKNLVLGAQAIKAGKEYIPSNVLINAYGNALKNAQNDRAYAALLLQLPSTNDLMQIMQDCAPENIFAAREILAMSICENHQSIIEEIHKSYNPHQKFVPDAEGEGQRALNAQCLYYLSFSKNGANFANNAYDKSTNMTDKMAALSALSRIGGADFANVLAKFKNKFASNPHVMDKYYSLRAASPTGDIIANLDSLLKDEGFEITNPNRVRAIIGAFSISNPIGFHQKDGAGYKAICDFLFDYDKVNPSVAARLATAFERVTKVEKSRRDLAKMQIDALLVQGISKQLHEILGGIIKSL